MAAPIFKKSKVYQRFNLKDLFGIDFSDMPELKQAFGQAVIDKILTRTEKGDWRANSSPSKKADSYSKAYENSLAFKAAGKTKGKVNMKLFGDMLGTMDIIEDTPNTITVGWNDELQSAKAYNHNTGDTLPRRPFFGLSASETTKLKNDLKDQVLEAVQSLKEDGRDAFTEKAMAIIDQLSNDGGDDGEN
jgi:phage gpG-like protein